MMQGRQNIKDIIAALTDANDRARLDTLYKTLTMLLDQQYLRIVDWWHLMPPYELHNRLTLEEEKKLRAGATTSAGMPSKVIKEAAKSTESRIKVLRREDRMMAGLKRKASEKNDVHGHRDKRRRKRLTLEDDEDDEEEVRFDFEVFESLVFTLVDV